MDSNEDSSEVDRIGKMFEQLKTMGLPNAAAWLLVDAVSFSRADDVTKSKISDHAFETLAAHMSDERAQDVRTAIQHALFVMETYMAAARGKIAIRGLPPGKTTARHSNPILELAMRFNADDIGDGVATVDTLNFWKSKLREAAKDWKPTLAPGETGRQ